MKVGAQKCVTQRVRNNAGSAMSRGLGPPAAKKSRVWSSAISTMTSPRKRSMLSRRTRPAARDTSLAPATRGMFTGRRSTLVMRAFLGWRPGAQAVVLTMVCTDARNSRFEMIGWRRCLNRRNTRPGEEGRSSRLAALFHAVPPRADAGHGIVIARDHLDRLALTVLGGLDAELARFLLLFRRHPAALVTPQARTEFALERLPGVVVDQLAAPAVLHQKARRVPGIERGDVIAGMAAERDADALGVAEREIVALAHIVEAVELHHHVMDHV